MSNNETLVSSISGWRSKINFLIIRLYNDWVFNENDKTINVKLYWPKEM